MSPHDVAHEVATAAGEYLLGVRAKAASGAEPLEGLGKRADKLADTLIAEALAKASPGVPILSEEAEDDAARYEAPRVWVVDPLDGTREFGELDRSDWAVHVAFVEDGVPTAAAVALPAQGVTFSTAGRLPVPGELPGRPRILVSRSRPPALAEAVRAALDGELVPMGSAGAKAMAVVQGRAEVYVHAGGQYEWDSAAPVGVAVAAGLHCSRIDGSALRYNQPHPRPAVPDLLVCRPELAEAVLAAVAAFTS